MSHETLALTAIADIVSCMLTTDSISRFHVKADDGRAYFRYNSATDELCIADAQATDETNTLPLLLDLVVHLTCLNVDIIVETVPGKWHKAIEEKIKYQKINRIYEPLGLMPDQDEDNARTWKLFRKESYACRSMREAIARI